MFKKEYETKEIESIKYQMKNENYEMVENLGKKRKRSEEVPLNINVVNDEETARILKQKDKREREELEQNIKKRDKERFIGTHSYFVKRQKH